MENLTFDTDTFDNCLVSILNLTKAKVAEIFPEAHFPSKFEECQHASKSYEHGCMKFYFSLTAHNRERILKNAQDIPMWGSNSIWTKCIAKHLPLIASNSHSTHFHQN